MDDNEVDIIGSTLAHQRRAEWLFAAAAFCNPDAKQECGWLSPDLLKDIKVREYWRSILAGADPSKAAMEQGIFYELSKHMSVQTFSSMYISSFAETVADDIYLVDIAQALGKLAGAIGERQTQEVQRLIGDLNRRTPGGHTEGDMAVEASLEFMATIDDLPSVVKTGLRKLDDKFGGFSRQTLNLLAARPSMGKTAMAIQYARACVDRGGVALYFSIEMSRKALWSRMVCGDAKVDSRLYKSRTWNADQRQACIDANNALQAQYGERMVIKDGSNVHSADIWKACAQYRPDLLIVDHLALVADKGDNNNLRVGAISWAGKAMAKEFDCAALYLCQLSRDVEKREQKVPTLSDLRDSGELEQNADTVLFIHRDDYYVLVKNPPPVSPTKLVLAKDREGMRNVEFDLQYHLIRQAFFETAQEANQ